MKEPFLWEGRDPEIEGGTVRAKCPSRLSPPEILSIPGYVDFPEVQDVVGAEFKTTRGPSE